MRKIAGLLSVLTLTFGTAASFAAEQKVILKPTTKGTRVTEVLMAEREPASLAQLKAQNKLSTATNNFLVKEKQGASFKNGTASTIPYFNSWFITGYRNSVYTYSMAGHSPKAGGTTAINNELIPLITQLFDANGNLAFVFDPTVAVDTEGSDASLMVQSPIYVDTAYPGGGGFAPDTGQFADTNLRASFTGVKNAGWHTPLNPPTSPKTQYVMQLFLNNGDWALACCDGNGKNFPVVNINSISNVFGQIITSENPANSTVPIILTDYVAAFSGGNCCMLGFHTAQNWSNPIPGILVWTWATFIPQSNDNGLTNPFFPFGQDILVMSHEITELFNDPFVNTLVSPWVDGSVSFAQNNLETGDVIETMADQDADYPVPSNTIGGPYTFHVQNQATLQWFARNPKSPQVGPGRGVYSWPNTNTLNNGHPCVTQRWVYGEGPAGFLFDDGSPTGQCH